MSDEYMPERRAVDQALIQLLAVKIKDMQDAQFTTVDMGNKLTHDILVLVPEVTSKMVEVITGSAPSGAELDKIFQAAMRLYHHNRTEGSAGGCGH